MSKSFVRRGGTVLGLAAFATAASAQTASEPRHDDALNATPLQRIDIESFGRVQDDDYFAEPIDASGGGPGCPIWWDNGPRDDVTAHLAQNNSTGSFRVADDFFIKEGTFGWVDDITVCFYVSESIDGLMNKPDFDLYIYDDCNGRPNSIIFSIIGTERVSAVNVGPAPFVGFNLWEVTYDVDQFFPGYQRLWVCPRGLGEFQDGFYYWASANNGVIQGAQTQLSNGPEPWADVTECDCPGICTDMYFTICGDVCCLQKNNMPFATDGGGKSLQLKGAIVDTSRAVDNFQIEPDGRVALCRFEAWMATNCPPEKIFLEIYSNDCNMPAFKVCTIDIPEYPLYTDTGTTFDGCTIYHLVWPEIGRVFFDPGRDYWVSVVARGTGSILDKAIWMYKLDFDPATGNPICHLNITQGKVKDVFVEGLEDFTFVSEATGGPPRDFAFKLYISALPPGRDANDPTGTGASDDGGSMQEPMASPAPNSLSQPLTR